MSATYNTYVQPPDDIRSGLERLGIDTESLEKEDKLGITDYYSATLGQKPNPGIFLKVSEESIRYLADGMKAQPAPGHLNVSDDESTYARFNDEKAWVELELTRYLPGSRMRKITQVIGVMMGTQSDWAYKRLEGAFDGIIDFKLEEMGGKTRSVMRIRNMRNVRFDSQWHPLRISENFQVTLE